jgi:hypothetical protein
MVNYNYKKWFLSSDLTGKKPLLRYIINKNYTRTISKDLANNTAGQKSPVPGVIIHPSVESY